MVSIPLVSPSAPKAATPASRLVTVTTFPLSPLLDSAANPTTLLPPKRCTTAEAS